MPRPGLMLTFAALLTGATLPAGAQTAPMQPQAQAPMDQGVAPRATRPQRPPITTLDFSQMNAGQRRRVQQAMAGPGQTPMMADQAAQRWASMDVRQRRAALRATRPAPRERGPRQNVPAMQQ